MTENNQKEANTGCRWVKFNEFGGLKGCENITAWYALQELHPASPDTTIDSMFNEIYCRPCLEGQKIETTNRILSAFYIQTNHPGYLGKIAMLVIEKLKTSH
jgi:hypothetical protein